MRAPRHKYTWHDYVVLAGDSNVKLEYFDGEIFAMAGGTPSHAAMAMSVGGELREQLRGRGCTVFSSDLRIVVSVTGLATYPDVSVVCGPLEHDARDRNSVTNPVVLVEVLSESTESYDRGAKFEHYQRIASLKEYVVVSHRERLIEVWRRTSSGEWHHSEARAGASVRLESINCALAVDRIFEGVPLHES